MKASELIASLQKLVEQNGDLDVVTHEGGGYLAVRGHPSVVVGIPEQNSLVLDYLSSEQASRYGRDLANHEHLICIDG